ncbi:uncharacterized protein SOCEGT47_019700 [Sorangium cellulosum]|uniref:DUF4365 domain-containing protein n=1 Tax=Sorangium cellulosum TaxID=56 RepID=A0A4P2PY41_SORCE|nr:DUF4365 domain-containing protein [Sorangium cellulosum]AUX21486.1 uncharacterized protein SOCEGT47_019700 [Sorangium cellulosum]
MASDKARFFAERAEYLATMFLTRHPDVSVERPSHDYGIDLLVSVKSSERSAELFGVVVKGDIEVEKTLLSDRSRVRATVATALRKQVEHATFPIGVLIFDMRTDEGYFGWVLQPRVAGSVSPGLTLQSSIDVAALDEERLEHVVADVQAWYNARLRRRRALG